jgi:hypothetical protein
MSDNPYESPQTSTESPAGSQPPAGNLSAIRRAIYCILVSGTALGILGLMFAPVGRTPQLTNAIGATVWVLALVIGYFEYKRAIRSGPR